MQASPASLNVIPGFTTMTKQEMFDISSAHILKTRRLCKIGGDCSYSGQGCAAAPFLTKEARGRLVGGWMYLVIGDKVPDHQASFVLRLQRCHDDCDGVGTGLFVDAWKGHMKELASNYGLSTHIIDADTGEG